MALSKCQKIKANSSVKVKSWSLHQTTLKGHAYMIILFYGFLDQMYPWAQGIGKKLEIQVGKIRS